MEVNLSLVTPSSDERELASNLDAMQLYSPSQVTLYDLPNDVLRLIVLVLSDVIILDARDKYGYGRRGMNALRLVSKRIMQVVESCSTRLTDSSSSAISLPFNDKDRCGSLEVIRSHSWLLSSLEGCPDGLKTLVLNGRSIVSLEPLRGCSELQFLEIYAAHEVYDLSPLADFRKIKTLVMNHSLITSLSPIASLSQLEELGFCKKAGQTSIKDLSPLSSFLGLKELALDGNFELHDLSPLSACTALKALSISSCSQTANLSPLSHLMCLQSLKCRDLRTSARPLCPCKNLVYLEGSESLHDLQDLKSALPFLKTNIIHNVHVW